MKPCSCEFEIIIHLPVKKSNIILIQAKKMKNKTKRPFLTIIIAFTTMFFALYFSVSASPLLQRLKQEKNEANEAVVCSIARKAVEQKVRNGKVISLPSSLPGFVKEPSGAFVTIVKGKNVVGCMGTMEPREKNLGLEIIRSANMAAAMDPWHKPLRESDLPKLKYIVSIPGTPKQITSSAQLNPAKLGLLVRKGKRSALLLPGEALTPEWQVYQCKIKAGIPQNEKVEMYIFETVTFGPK